MKPSEHKAQIMATLMAGMLVANGTPFIRDSMAEIAEEGYDLIMARCQTLPAPADTEDSDAQA